MVRAVVVRAVVAASMALAGGAVAKRTPLADPPDWAALDAYHETITRGEFEALLGRVYAPGGAADDVVRIREDAAEIVTGSGRPPYVLRFATSREEARPVPGWWRMRSQIPAGPSGKPLAGVRIAIDPGHLGGPWAKVEERWFRVGDGKPVIEGDMTLLVAKRLAARLKDLGASVSLTRSKPGPTTRDRPAKLLKEAAASLADSGRRATPSALKAESERLFYRVSEIRHRARLVNKSLRPDLVLCLHFNAEAWGNENKPVLVRDSHLHFLVTGAWSARELAYEDQRHDMLVKLLGRTFPEELAVTNALARSMAGATRLPPYTYRSPNAVRVDDNPYVWARNLLANRLFQCPVVYVEPYVMNSRGDFARIQAGDYEGTRVIGGVPRKSIYREYADSLAQGLADYYSKR
jgi:N-acetylmuramoyl-L-alanine amidase